MPELSQKTKEALFRACEQHPFFGMTLMGMSIQETSSEQVTPTSLTDGETLILNTDWINSLRRRERVGVLLHQAMHGVMEDHLRRGERDEGLWNLATDLVNNTILNNAGVRLPADFPKLEHGSSLTNLSKEQVYAWLEKNMPPPPPQGGSGDNENEGNSGQGQSDTDYSSDQEDKPGGGSGKTDEGQPKSKSGSGSKPKPNKADDKIKNMGQDQLQNLPQLKDLKNKDGSSLSRLEREEKQAEAHQNNVANARATEKSIGHTPGYLNPIIQDTERRHELDWREVLAEFFKALRKPAGPDWSRPHKKKYAAGFYGPSRRKSPQLGDIVVAVDVSGSMSEPELRAIEAELKSLFSDCKPKSVVVMYFDCSIPRLDIYGRNNFSHDCAHHHDLKEFKLESMSTGGGTDFEVVFDNVTRWEINPDALLVFTDGKAHVDFGEPDYPVLWAITEIGTEQYVSRWGKRTRIKLGDN